MFQYRWQFFILNTIPRVRIDKKMARCVPERRWFHRKRFIDIIAFEFHFHRVQLLCEFLCNESNAKHEIKLSSLSTIIRIHKFFVFIGFGCAIKSIYDVNCGQGFFRVLITSKLQSWYCSRRDVKL